MTPVLLLAAPCSLLLLVVSIDLRPAGSVHRRQLELLPSPKGVSGSAFLELILVLLRRQPWGFVMP